ncbi:histidine phosphatase family protein [Novosphingobium gossypii]|uniref:histidine phosphatase family protein n=1 Tax=Novosphingobium gossypii TaxID=1604774 RepID=UPI003D1C136F
MTGTLLHLMRHGAPERPGRLLGHVDEPALPTEDARCVVRAQGLEFATVISSDLCRTSMPAGDIAAIRGCPYHVDADWRELDFGEWTGRAVHELDAAAYERFWNDPDAYAPPGGERWSDLRSRVVRAIDRLHGPALVITHGGAMRAALSVLCGMDHRQVWAFDLPCTALLTLRLWPGDAPTAQIVGLAP